MALCKKQLFEIHRLKVYITDGMNCIVHAAEKTDVWIDIKKNVIIMEKAEFGGIEELMEHPVFRHFGRICRIPHGSGNERELSDYLKRWAEERGLRCVQDENLNIIIYKPAAHGYEGLPGVILQAHMDMVCEKASDSEHDFEKDPIELYLDDDILSGRGQTSIGADDGIGVSLALAILEDKALKHPPLEVLFTVEEESTFKGIETVDGRLFDGDYLINLDYFVDDQVLVSGCGGIGVKIKLPISYETAEYEMMAYEVKIENLTGGHSGGDIHKARGNANELFWRTLRLYEAELEAELVSIEGGTSRVAIPRETKGVILIDREQTEKLEELTERLQNAFRAEYQVTAPHLNVKIRAMGPYTGRYMYYPSFRKLLKLVYLVPNGIMEMNGALDMRGLVESSINQGVMRSGENFFVLVGEIRYSHISSRNFIIEKIMALSELLEAKVELFAPYPAWNYRRRSDLRQLAVKTYRELFDEKLKPVAVHAGIECGCLLEKLPHLDAISIGANCWYFHSVNECVSVSSVHKVWCFLKQLLENLDREFEEEE